MINVLSGSYTECCPGNIPNNGLEIDVFFVVVWDRRNWLSMERYRSVHAHTPFVHRVTGGSTKSQEFQREDVAGQGIGDREVFHEHLVQPTLSLRFRRFQLKEVLKGLDREYLKNRVISCFTYFTKIDPLLLAWMISAGISG